jgi:tetratricopeptide (TPR) repeat protein
LKQDANVIGARRQLVALLVEAGEFESARNVISAGMSANPRNYQLYQDFVMIDLKATGVDAALATADRLQSQDRDFPAIRALRGDIYLAANRSADAVTAFTEANNAAPSGVLVTRLAGALLRMFRPDDAIRLLDGWVTKHPQETVALEQISEICIATNKFDDAIKYLENLLKVQPHDAVALNNLAWVYQQKGDNTKAQAYARRAYVLAPSAQTADTLGWILTNSGNLEGGVALLRQATGETNLADPRILYHFAVALKGVGNRDEAKKNLEIVIANKNDFKEKTEAKKLLEDMAKGS